MYDKLRDLLAAGKWKEANEETWKIKWTQDDKVLVLNTIDSLWVEYSKAQFGFSIQKRILERVFQEWESAHDELFKICCGQTDKYNPDPEYIAKKKKSRLIYETFVKCVGWGKPSVSKTLTEFTMPNFGYMRRDSEIIFSLEAPEGHLPYNGGWNLNNFEPHYSDIVGSVNKISSFYSCIKDNI